MVWHKNYFFGSEVLQLLKVREQTCSAQVVLVPAYLFSLELSISCDLPPKRSRWSTSLLLATLETVSLTFILAINILVLYSG